MGLPDGTFRIHLQHNQVANAITATPATITNCLRCAIRLCSSAVRRNRRDASKSCSILSGCEGSDSHSRTDGPVCSSKTDLSCCRARSIPSDRCWAWGRSSRLAHGFCMLIGVFRRTRGSIRHMRTMPCPGGGRIRDSNVGFGVG